MDTSWMFLILAVNSGFRNWLYLFFFFFWQGGLGFREEEERSREGEVPVVHPIQSEYHRFKSHTCWSHYWVVLLRSKPLWVEDVLPVPPYLIFNEKEIWKKIKTSYQTLGLHTILRVLSREVGSSQILEFMRCGFYLQPCHSSSWLWVSHRAPLTSVSSSVKWI